MYGVRGKDNDVCILILFYFLSFIWFLRDKGRGGGLQERGESDILAGRRRKERKKESRVSLLLVALLTQPALGQYLITCTAEQHAISTY